MEQIVTPSSVFCDIVDTESLSAKDDTEMLDPKESIPEPRGREDIRRTILYGKAQALCLRMQTMSALPSDAAETK